MPLFKDLASCGIRFMRFSFHLSGGLELLDGFWENRGLERGEERLAFGKYVRSQRTHTVFITWTRSHAACADVVLAMDSRKPEDLFPGRGKKHRLLTQEAFVEFFNIVRTADAPWGIKGEYGYPSQRYIGASYRSDKSLRMTRASFEALDDDGKPLMYLDHFLTKGKWLTVIEPAGRMHFLSEPVSDNFFDAPYSMACALAASLRRQDK